jgi:hypothetical protein
MLWHYLVIDMLAIIRTFETMGPNMSREAEEGQQGTGTYHDIFLSRQSEFAMFSVGIIHATVYRTTTGTTTVAESLGLLNALSEENRLIFACRLIEEIQ